MIKAIVFDYDGVLVDTLEIHKKIYKVLGEELNIPQWTQLGNKIDSFNVDWHETSKAVGLKIPEDIPIIERIYFRELRKLNPQTKLFPGIRKLVSSLSGYKRAVLSNNSRVEIEKALSALDMNHFDSVVGGEDGKLKPDPELFNITMERLNVKPEETVYICDMKEEIIGARNAKITKTIAVSYGYHSKEHLEEANPDHIVDKPEEILSLIKK